MPRLSRLRGFNNQSIGRSIGSRRPGIRAIEGDPIVKVVGDSLVAGWGVSNVGDGAGLMQLWITDERRRPLAKSGIVPVPPGATVSLEAHWPDVAAPSGPPGPTGSQTQHEMLLGLLNVNQAGTVLNQIAWDRYTLLLRQPGPSLSIIHRPVFS